MKNQSLPPSIEYYSTKHFFARYKAVFDEWNAKNKHMKFIIRKSSSTPRVTIDSTRKLTEIIINSQPNRYEYRQLNEYRQLLVSAPDNCLYSSCLEVFEDENGIVEKIFITTYIDKNKKARLMPISFGRFAQKREDAINEFHESVCMTQQASLAIALFCKDKDIIIPIIQQLGKLHVEWKYQAYEQDETKYRNGTINCIKTFCRNPFEFVNHEIHSSSHRDEWKFTIDIRKYIKELYLQHGIEVSE